MGKMVGFIYMIAWGNPYTEPPEGQPRVKAVYFEPSVDGTGARVPKVMNGLKEPGSGYSMMIGFLEEPIKVKTEEQLRTSRRKRLNRKLKKEVPLFAEHFEREELDRSHEYYDGHSRYEQERQEALERDQRRFEFLMNHQSELLLSADYADLCEYFGL